MIIHDNQNRESPVEDVFYRALKPVFHRGGELEKMERAKGFEPSTFTLAR
jgi:hypothetical protein